RIRVQVSDRSLAAENPVADALLRVLDLASGRLAATAVMDLLSLPVVHPRFGIDEAELPTLYDWAAESGMRWGVDEDDRERAGQPRSRANTFRFGLERLALGVVADADALVLGALPYDDVEGSASQLLVGRFIAYCETLFEAREALAEAGTVESFSTRTRAVLASLTATSAPWEAEAVLDAIAAVESEASAAGFDAELTLDAYRRALEPRLGGGADGDRQIAQAVTLCALSPMRSVPFRVICLLGMDDGAFPRATTAPGFDLAAREPRVGDRDPRDEDRHLLLEALLSARKHLRIFYTGREPRSGEVRAPAVPIAELLAFIESTYAFAGEGPLRRHLVVEHPLQPFSAGEHLPRIADPRAPETLRPMGFDPRLYEAARRLSSPRIDRIGPLDAVALEDAPVDTIGIAELVDFLRCPVKHLLRRRLGVVLEEGDSGLEDREPLELAGLERWSFESELLEKALGNEDERFDWAHAASLARAGGAL
ncbi:MAG: exodeoxyribonuclease V subunit gamma, partial [Polyangiaceae bacterium]|nr:exodeoxyribonuclease V subunit gamma [Polyangiaceae bacterium]